LSWACCKKGLAVKKIDADIIPTNAISITFDSVVLDLLAILKLLELYLEL